jgi:hypothetical protein
MSRPLPPCGYCFFRVLPDEASLPEEPLIP